MGGLCPSPLPQDDVASAGPPPEEGKREGRCARPSGGALAKGGGDAVKAAKSTSASCSSCCSLASSMERANQCCRLCPPCKEGGGRGREDCSVAAALRGGEA